MASAQTRCTAFGRHEAALGPHAAGVVFREHEAIGWPVCAPVRIEKSATARGVVEIAMICAIPDAEFSFRVDQAGTQRCPRQWVRLAAQT
jgi:hypothetical protein